MNRDYFAGITRGRIEERERIISLIEKRADEWGGHDGYCDCLAKAEEDRDIIQLIGRVHHPDCLVSEGKWDAGCTCEKGIAERVKKV